MSICKKIIDQMGCEINVESEVGTGTTFKIDICSKFKIKSDIIKQMKLK